MGLVWAAEVLSFLARHVVAGFAFDDQCSVTLCPLWGLTANDAALSLPNARRAVTEANRFSPLVALLLYCIALCFLAAVIAAAYILAWVILYPLVHRDLVAIVWIDMMSSSL